MSTLVENQAISSHTCYVAQQRANKNLGGCCCYPVTKLEDTVFIGNTIVKHAVKDNVCITTMTFKRSPLIVAETSL